MGRAPLEMLTGEVQEPAATGGARSRTRSTRGLKRSGQVLGRRRADMLASVPLFSGLARRHLRDLAQLADEVRYRAGERVVRQGQLGETFYVILEGEAKVVRGGRTVARLRPGDFFGEISLLDGGPRTATVVAETPLVAVRIHRREFVRLVRAEPDVGVRVLAEVAQRIRRADRPLTG